MSARTESNDEEVQDIVKVYDLDVDWPIKTVGITGLKANFGRDGGIEERYWGPSLTLYLGQAPMFHMVILLLSAVV